MVKITEAELEELAKNLRCPDGDEGLKVAEMMNVTNSNIISKTIDCLDLVKGDSIVEIGPGNGLHVRDLISLAENIDYVGIDISETMINEASERYKDDDNISFRLTDGKSIAFPANSFDKVFTVNTIYFWQDPEVYITQAARVLKNGGQLAIGYIPQRIMQKIPFAKYGFTMYKEPQVKALLESAGLKITNEITETEYITGNNGEKIERDFVIACAKKL